jgi:hypothetical protein
MSLGQIELLHGNFCDNTFIASLAEADVIFANNAEEIFAARSQHKESDPYLDLYVAKIFARQKPGSKTATFHYLPLGPSLTEANRRRKKQKKQYNQNASFYEVEKYTLGRCSVTWTTRELHVYIYTRTENTYNSRTPLFVCEKCDHAFSVLCKNDGFLIDKCPGCEAKRPTAGGREVTVRKNYKCI